MSILDDLKEQYREPSTSERELLRTTMGLGLTAIDTNRRGIALACASYVMAMANTSEGIEDWLDPDDVVRMAARFDDFLLNGE